MDAENEELKFEEIANIKDAKKKIVPNWLVEVLAWIKRKEIAKSSLSTSCWTFKQLCWPKLHGKVKSRTVKWMEFWPELNESGNVRAKLLLLQKVEDDAEVHGKDAVPIAQIAPPDYIIGFEFIVLHWLDAQILQFIEIIRPLLKDIYLSFGMNFNTWNVERLEKEREIAKMRNLIANLNDKIFAINLGCYYFNEVNRRFPGLLDQIQFIKTNYGEIDEILQWLSSRNNHQKMVEIDFDDNQKFEFIGRIMQDFLRATQPSNCLIMPCFDEDLAEFTLENERTGEILNLYHKRDPTMEGDLVMYPFIARHTKGEKDWKERGEQKYWPLLGEPYSNRIILNIQPESIVTENREQMRNEVKAGRRVNYAAILIMICLLLAVILFFQYTLNL